MPRSPVIRPSWKTSSATSSSRRTSSRCCSRRTGRATSLRWLGAATRSSSPAIHTFSARSRLGPQPAFKTEQEGREGIFHHVPENLPALLYARKLQRRAATIGFDYPDVVGALADLDDELRELREALADAGESPPETEPDPHVFEEVGDVLFAAVNVARRLNVDPELALRTMATRFADRVERAEALAAAEGRHFIELTLEEKDRYFDAAKEEFR
jgi:NTP pyrophosphatase (non-canonical NTP hydrolase)